MSPILVDKILVAEDEPDIRNLVKTILEKRSYEVITVSNGVEAEEKIVTELPDFVLLDIVMPKKGGFEVCKSIKNNKNTHFIPVVTFSVLGRTIDKEMSKEAGADGHITKPFLPEELLRQIQDYIQESKITRFSRAAEQDHELLSGRTILFEYNSSTPYERHIRDFLLEGLRNGETPIIITNKSSAIFNTIKNEEKISIIPFQVPVVLSQVFKKSSDNKHCFVFDSLTDLILSAGFQTAYNFIKDSLTRFSSDEFSALYLLNSDSHDIQEVQRIRNLYRNQIKCDEGIRVIKLG